jgi:Lrp/AsnC family leucine-responsive transcriptional regulator
MPNRAKTIATRPESSRRPAQARIDAGLDLTIFVQLKVERHSQETSSRVEEALTAIPAVVACYVISGETDFLIEVAAPTLAAYERILLDQILVIPAVIDARSTLAIRTVKSRGPLPVF